jgi:hypothetical protein
MLMPLGANVLTTVDGRGPYRLCDIKKFAK